MPIGSMYEMPGHLIRRAHQISGAIFTARLAGFDITSVQYAAMVAITSQPGIDATRLSDLIAFDRATLGGVLDRLEAKGLVARERSTTDRRVVQIALTPEGQAVAARVPPVLADVLNGHLSDFTHDEWQQLLHLLRRMLANGEARRQQQQAQNP